MKNGKFTIIVILLFLISLFNVIAGGEENPTEQGVCSKDTGLILGAICKFMDKIVSSLESLSSKIEEAFNSLISHTPNPKGNIKLWEISYQLSFTIAIILVIVSIIFYLKESMKENSNVEILNRHKEQFFNFILMLVFVKGSEFLAGMALEGVQVLNGYILSSMTSGGAILFGVIFSLFLSIGTLIVLTIATGGLLFVGIMLAFLAFFIVLVMRSVILVVLLSVLPIAIVLYFFHYTKKIGGMLLRILVSHTIITTIWIVVFAIAFDYPTQFVNTDFYLFLTAFMPFTAAIINAWLYFKINKFFGSLGAITGYAPIVHKVVERRIEIIRERIEMRPQTKLTKYTR